MTRKDKHIIALGQIFLLIIGIVAFNYALGSEIKFISAKTSSDCDKLEGPNWNPEELDNGEVGFCYGSNDLGYHFYKVLSSTRIIDDRNILYRAPEGTETSWQYSTDNGASWKAVVSQPQFDSRSNSAITLYSSTKSIGEQQTEEEEEELTIVVQDCDTLCRAEYGRVSGACETLSLTSDQSCSNGGLLVSGDYCPKTGVYQRSVCCCSSETLEDETETSSAILPSGKYANYASEVYSQLSGKDSKKEEVESKTKEAKTYKEAPWIGGTSWYSYLLGHVIQGVSFSAGIITANEFVQQYLPEKYQTLADAYAWTAAGAVFAGKTFMGISEAFWPATRPAEGELLGWSSAIGVGIAAIYFLAAFRYENYEIITFECQPWNSDTGGENCEKCNNQGVLPCSEYQCRSLGQGCQLVNQGTDEEKCVWVTQGDSAFPIIEALEEALINNNYEYTPDNAISPPDRGVIINYDLSEDGCVPAFTPLSFGIKLDEPAKCKFDTSRKKDFENMNFYFSGGLLLEEHEYALTLPGAGGEIEIENDEEYNLYVKCEDANGNVNTANFVFNFCVDAGPDTTAPLIVQTSILNGMPIAFDQNSVDLEVYLNEPVSGCRWSKLDQDYANMEEEMNCVRGNDLQDINNRGLYTCETNLDGLKNEVENNFYFRCEDLSGNANTESYQFSLIGTQPLVIDWILPEEGTLIKDSTERVTVTLEAQTSAGYNEGESKCYFSDTGNENDYVLFFNTDSYQHSQDLQLSEGNYIYFIKCVDLGGNIDVESVNFDVESDSSSPIVVRASHEENYLKITTSEPARCVYDTTYENYPCDYAFDDGNEMTVLEEINHYIGWDTNSIMYIKCQDEYGNQPNPDQCSIIVKPSEILG